MRLSVVLEGRFTGYETIPIEIPSWSSTLSSSKFLREGQKKIITSAKSYKVWFSHCRFAANERRNVVKEEPRPFGMAAPTTEIKWALQGASYPLLILLFACSNAPLRGKVGIPTGILPWGSKSGIDGNALCQAKSNSSLARPNPNTVAVG